jgi:hypothetical protein
LSGTHWLVVCFDVNAVGEGINTIKESTESILGDKKFRSKCKENYV